MANSKKGEQVTLVQFCLGERAKQVGWIPPIATPELVRAIYGMQFTSPDLDNLTGALNIFHVVPANDGRAPAMRERQDVYSMVHGGSAAPTIEQLRVLVDAAPQMARDLVSLISTFRAYLITLDVVLGSNQPLSNAFRYFVQRWELEAQPIVHNVYSATEIPALMPLFQRRIQLETQLWLNQVAYMPAGAFPPMPDFGTIIRDVLMRQWHNFQAIPARYTHHPPPPVPALPRLNGGGAPGATPPGGPIPPPPATPPARNPPASNSVSNPNPNAALLARYARYGGRLRVLTGQLRTQLPLADDGTTQLCLAYCLTGMCNSNCARRGTHRPLTSAEEGRIGAFLTAGNIE